MYRDSDIVALMKRLEANPDEVAQEAFRAIRHLRTFLLDAERRIEVLTRPALQNALSSATYMMQVDEVLRALREECGCGGCDGKWCNCAYIRQERKIRGKARERRKVV